MFWDINKDIILRVLFHISAYPLYIYVCVCDALSRTVIVIKKWNLLPEFKSLSRLISDHFMLIPLEKAGIHVTLLLSRWVMKNAGVLRCLLCSSSLPVVSKKKS